MNLAKIKNYLLLLPIVLPLIFTPFTFQPWHFGKTILFVILVDIIILLVGIDFLKRKKIELRTFDKLDTLITVLFIIFLLSSIFAFDSERAFFSTLVRMNGLLILFHFYLYYLLLRQFFVFADWIKVFRITAVVGFLSIIIAWLGPVISWFAGAVVGGYGRLNGLFGNPIFLASYLWVFIIIIFLAIIKDKISQKWRYFYYFNILASILTIFATGTRGAVLAFFVALLFLFIAYIFFVSNSRKTKIYGLAILLVIFGLIGYLYSPWIYELRSQLPQNIAQVFNLSLDSLGTTTRLMAWDIAWQGFLDRPILGWGISNFQYTFDKFYNPDFLSYGLSETVWDIPHNEFLEVLVSTGIFAFGLMLFILVLFLKRAWALIYKEDKQNRFLFILLLSASVAYVTQAMFAAESSNTLVYLVLLFAVLQYGKGKQKFITFVSYKKIIILILIFLSLCSLFWGFKTLIMSNYLLKARNYREINNISAWQENAKNSLRYKGSYVWEQSIHLSVDLLNFNTNSRAGDDLESITNDLITNLETKNNKLGENYLINFWLAQLYGDKGEYVNNIYFQNALEYLDRALSINEDRQYPIFLKSRYLLSLQRIDEAEQELRNLIAKDDTIIEPHWLLGAVLSAKGDLVGSATSFEKAIDLGYSLDKVSDVLFVIDIYAQLEEYEKIIPLYELLIEREPTQADWYARLAAVYAAIGNEDKVIEYIYKAVDINPSLIEEAKEFLKLNNIEL